MHTKPANPNGWRQGMNPDRKVTMRVITTYDKVLLLIFYRYNPEHVEALKRMQKEAPNAPIQAFDMDGNKVWVKLHELDLDDFVLRSLNP